MKKIVISTLLIVCLIAAIAVPVMASEYWIQKNLYNAYYTYYDSNMNCVYEPMGTYVSASTQLYSRSGTIGGFATTTMWDFNGNGVEAHSDTLTATGFHSGNAIMSVDHARKVEHHACRNTTSSGTDYWTYTAVHSDYVN